MTHRTLRAVLLTLGALLSAGLPLRRAEGQVVQGTLLRADSTPAAGVIVVAVRGARDSVLARTMTNGSGRFALTLTPGEVRLRALRIGHHPFAFAAYTLSAGARREARAVLPNDPIVLSAVTTEASSSCRQSGTAGAQVATVFEEVRKALLASTLKSGDGDPLARLSVYEQARSVGNRAFREPTLEFQEGVTVKPFQSIKPDSLAKVGYMQPDSIAALYHAPDAEVLLSESFASTHCLGLTEGKGERAGWIGLTFRPQQFRRGYVDVRGTLWLDRATNELRRMQYTYDGLPITMQRAEPGGDVEFTRLPDGIWFVSRWEIRMPRMTLPPGTPRLVGMWVKGGEVWWIKRGRDVLYTNGRVEPAPAKLAAAEEAARAVADSVNARAALEACATVPAGAPKGVVQGTVVDERGTVLPDAVVTVEWQDSHAFAGRQLSWRTQGLSTITARDGTFAVCGVAERQALTVTAQYGGRKTPKVSTRIAEGAHAVRLDLRVAGVRAAVPRVP
ncbi:MAG: carboxypeptidase regulatory-like domain-containing protein [Gemmatimonadetes bacterium]|nr:carboxypeptidase regulatory-like domain-containing protein [Gemmatimonadota bacterium]